MPSTGSGSDISNRSLERLNQLVTDALMIPLGMVVDDELGNRASHVAPRKVR